MRAEQDGSMQQFSIKCGLAPADAEGFCQETLQRVFKSCVVTHGANVGTISEVNTPFHAVETIVETSAGAAHLRPMSSVVVRNPEILSGTPVFAGTRVPVKNLTDSLRAARPSTSFWTIFPP